MSGQPHASTALLRYPSNRRVGGPQSRSGCLEKKGFCCTRSYRPSVWWPSAPFVLPAVSLLVSRSGRQRINSGCLLCIFDGIRISVRTFRLEACAKATEGWMQPRRGGIRCRAGENRSTPTYKRVLGLLAVGSV